MIHCIYNARFAEIDGVPGQCVAGHVFSMPDGDDYIQTQPIHAIWQEKGELYVEDKAGCTYQIADFDDAEAARQVVFIQRPRSHSRWLSRARRPEAATLRKFHPYTAYC
ncbi:hypothetical protein [Pseudomonas sp. IT-P218]|uniref:hypothetical protein n=1 Tax=Pseudomonas sp. IT-P218 TaxID=3026449 RepID=UPI0039E00606